MTPWTAKIKEVRRETADTFTWIFDPSELPTGYSFKPGQFNMLYVFGVGEVPISISGDPEAPGLVHTIRAVGAVTNVMKNMKAGETVGIRGPFGSDWPLEAAHGKDLVVIAGGIGLAPLRPAIYRVLAERERYDHFSLLYGARASHEMLYPEEVGEWRSRFDAIVRVTVDKSSNKWRGTVGVVTKLIPRIPLEGENTVAFICGPEIMMRFCVRELESRGVSLDNIYVSMERNMKCAVGTCGHCQYGGDFICKTGPVFPFSKIESRFYTKEV
jgi:NAD(P)H-flavin reductase